MTIIFTQFFGHFSPRSLLIHVIMVFLRSIVR